MRPLRLLGIAVVTVICLGLLGSRAFSADDDPQNQDAMMQAWMEYMKVGKEHEMLKEHFEGTWDCQIKWVMGGEQISQGTSEATMILGGRFLQQHFDGTMHGQPMQGMGITAYDNAKKKYIGTWMDSMGTGVMVSEGTYDPATKTYTLHGEMTIPDGSTSKTREVIKVIDDDKHTFELYMTGPDGSEMKAMEIVYTRK